MIPIKSSEITPEDVYKNRRQFMKGVGALALGAVVVAACGAPAAPAAEPTAEQRRRSRPRRPRPVSWSMSWAIPPTASRRSPTTTTSTSLPPTSSGWRNWPKDFPTNPWTVEVGGLVRNPKTFAIEDILSGFDQEERIYRLRCVEALVDGHPLAGLPAEQAAGPGRADGRRQIRALRDHPRPARTCPASAARAYEWPYVEGLRLDEAMNDLTLLSTGLYGQTLLPQNGAPLRLVVPWKYGFKSIKSIVKIDLVADQPSSLWMIAAPNEYGFYANVNPEVSHPRWSQRTERRIGESGRRETLMFNGYEEEVAGLYAGMDLADELLDPVNW